MSEAGTRAGHLRAASDGARDVLADCRGGEGTGHRPHSVQLAPSPSSSCANGPGARRHTQGSAAWRSLPRARDRDDTSRLTVRNGTPLPRACPVSLRRGTRHMRLGMAAGSDPPGAPGRDVLGQHTYRAASSSDGSCPRPFELQRVVSCAQTLRVRTYAEAGTERRAEAFVFESNPICIV
jgi:hypothetical protein